MSKAGECHQGRLPIQMLVQSDTHGSKGEMILWLEKKKKEYFHLYLKKYKKLDSHSEAAISEGQENNMAGWQEIAATIQLEFEYPD